ncbi:MAG: TetR/AcrR family transcriptional regulator, partial [Flavobacteriaceae bacterium]|nr:TetR/AcrR family transcriptional regulator [Flavobacteriaceae bacterium]
FNSTSMQSIAKIAGVSKGNLYNYFTSKQDLLKGVLNFGLDQFADFFDTTSVELITEKEFEAAIRGNFEMINSNKLFWKLYYNLFAQSKVQQIFTEIFTPFLEQFLTIFETYYINKGDKDPKATALLLGSTLDGVSLGYLMMGDTYPLQEVVDQLIEKFK